MPSIRKVARNMHDLDQQDVTAQDVEAAPGRQRGQNVAPPANDKRKIAGQQSPISTAFKQIEELRKQLEELSLKFSALHDVVVENAQVNREPNPRLQAGLLQRDFSALEQDYAAFKEAMAAPQTGLATVAAAKVFVLEKRLEGLQSQIEPLGPRIHQINDILIQQAKDNVEGAVNWDKRLKISEFALIQQHGKIRAVISALDEALEAIEEKLNDDNKRINGLALELERFITPNGGKKAKKKAAKLSKKAALRLSSTEERNEWNALLDGLKVELGE